MDSQDQFQDEQSAEKQKLRPTKGAYYFQKKVGPHFNSGKWTFRECLKYVQFLKKNSHKLDDSSRKKYNVFHRMSNFIKTRASTQCTSRHQKMMEKYSSIEGIIDNESKRLSQSVKEISEKSQSLNNKSENYDDLFDQKSSQSPIQAKISSCVGSDPLPEPIMLETQRTPTSDIICQYSFRQIPLDVWVSSLLDSSEHHDLHVQ